MSDLNEMIRQYAIESGDIVLPTEVPAGEVLQDVLADELEVSRSPDLTAKLAHADKAESIAEQLDVLADRADGLAAEDVTEATAAIAQVSAESLHREFGTIMTAHNLELKAESFEAAVGSDPKSQLEGLSRDARAASAMVVGFGDSLRDFSTEGAIMQFLRQDKARLQKSRAALEAASTKLNAKKGELSKEPVIVHHDGLKRFLIVNGAPVTNAKAAIDHDIQWLHKAAAAVNKAAGEIGTAVAGAKGEGDHAGAVEKLNSIAAGLTSGLDAQLLGNHSFSGSKRGGGEKFSGKAAGMAYIVGSFKALPGQLLMVIGGAAVGAAIIAASGGRAVGAGVAVAQAAGHAGNYHLGKKIGQDYQKRVEGTDEKSVAGANDLVGIVKDVLALSTATDFSMDQKVEEAGEKMEGADAAAKAAAKKALSAVSKLADVVYEHAVYLTVKSAQLVTSAADKA